MTFKEIPVLGAEDTTKVAEAARMELIIAHERVTEQLGKLNKDELKNIVKFVTGISDVDHLLTSNKYVFSEKENAFIDKLVAFEVCATGFYTLLNEL